MRDGTLRSGTARSTVAECSEHYCRVNQPSDLSASPVLFCESDRQNGAGDEHEPDKLGARIVVAVQ